MKQRADHPGAHTVYAYFARSEFLGKASRESDKPAFRSCVRQRSRTASITPCLRSNVDDRAAVRHLREYGLCHKPCALKVKIDDAVPELLVHFMHHLARNHSACVVYQDLNWTAVRLRRLLH
jgi:hypothetical protein